MLNKKKLTDFARIINSDRYQYTESDIFILEGMEEKETVFDAYFRKTENGGFAVVSGIKEIVELIHILNETDEKEKREYFSEIIEETHLCDYLCKLKFTGDLYAMREGEIVYPNEPILTIKAPLIQAKILETPILNILNMHLAIATKASMLSRAAYPAPVVSFGSRRAHGFDSAVSGTKASIVGGCLGHSNLMTEYKYGVPSSGTMSHSYIQSFGIGKEAEKKAFDYFIKHRRGRKNNTLLLLVDTYNTLYIGLKNAIESFKNAGIDDSYNGIYGIRIDSGDLAYLSKKCREELDMAGYKKAKIFITNSLDESLIKSLKSQGACVDFFGVGDALAVAKSNPCFGVVYKMVEIDNEPVIKLSEDVVKISNPGFKEVYRIYDKENMMYADLITLKSNDSDNEKLQKYEKILLVDEKYDFKFSVMKKNEYTYKKLTCEFIKNGIILDEAKKLENVVEAREYYLDSLKTISEERKRLENPHKSKINLSKDLKDLKYKLIKKITSEVKK